MTSSTLLLVTACVIIQLRFFCLCEKNNGRDDKDGGNFDEYNEDNSTGLYVGDRCEEKCEGSLIHVFCNQKTGICECEKKYPVKLAGASGCGKPKRLGEQCYYRETCAYNDQHSSCIQVHHNAVCMCKNGYHLVDIQKPSRRTFCAEDVRVMTTDLSTLIGVISGIAVLSGLICFVLKLFNETLYTGRPRYGNANLAPPMLFSGNEGGMSMPIISRSLTSRASSQRTLASLQSRRVSASGFRSSRAGAARAAAILLLSYHDRSGSSDPDPDIGSVPRIGSRRASLTSIHSASSYGAKKYERESRQREERRRIHSANSSANGTRCPPTPSPHSTDDLLPALEEVQQVFANQQIPLVIEEENPELPSTSRQYQ